MRAVVAVSLEDAGGDRCVDMICGPGGWARVECRRDPEDAHGWRRPHPLRHGFASGNAARAGAAGAVGWLAP